MLQADLSSNLISRHVRQIYYISIVRNFTSKIITQVYYCFCWLSAQPLSVFLVACFHDHVYWARIPLATMCLPLPSCWTQKLWSTSQQNFLLMINRLLGRLSEKSELYLTCMSGRLRWLAELTLSSLCPVNFIFCFNLYLVELSMRHRCCCHHHLSYIHGSLGGYGTLEELLEVITWAQLGIHSKPVIPVSLPKLYIANTHFG